MRTLLVLALLATPVVAERAPAGPITVTGTLVDENRAVADCGTFEIWTILAFDVSADAHAPRGTGIDAKHLPVAIPCVELARPRYSKSAGNAGVLVKRGRYRLTLDAPAPGKWGTRHAWAARRIDRAR